MKNVRRLILALSSFIGVWVLVSFGGAMFDSANAAFWSSSLIWSLLSCLIVMPALVMVSHATKQATRKKEQSPSEQEPFIQEESDEAHTLWPEPEHGTEWPTQQQKERERAHA